MTGNFIVELFSLTSRPPVTSYCKWLRNFFEIFPQYIDGDSLTSTYASISAVILTTMVADCRDVDFVQNLLRLPREFVDVTIDLMDGTSLWASEEMLDLECALRDDFDDLDIVEEVLDGVTERLWDLLHSEGLGMLFDFYRSGCLIGGAREHWVDDEPVNNYQMLM